MHFQWSIFNKVIDLVFHIYESKELVNSIQYSIFQALKYLVSSTIRHFNNQTYEDA